MKKYYFYFCLLLTTFSFSQIINFPDANFKAKLLQADVTNQIAFDTNGAIKIDSNNNGEIEISEANIVSELYISNSNIYDLTGIENFTSLYALDCSNNNLNSLNLNMLWLMSIWASHNNITSTNLDWEHLTGDLDLSYNQLTNFTIVPNTSNFHDWINLNHNNIITLNINGNVSNLDVSYNNLSNINSTGNIYIGGPESSYILNFSNNNFSNLDFNNYNIKISGGKLILGNNSNDLVNFNNWQPNIISLTTNNTTSNFGNFSKTNGCGSGDTGAIELINCPNLENIILKNGYNHTEITCTESTSFQIPALSLTIQNCPNLNYICVDEGEKQYIQTRINQLGLQNQIQVNSYCSFTPGGTYYTINGSTSTDYNNNSCGPGSQPAQNIKYAINDGTTTNYFFGNTIGNYSLPVGAGTYTVTPVLDNPTNYVVNPANYSITFPTASSPFTQNFCIQANSGTPIYNFDIVISPLTNAIPGFNSTYRIWFKNTGNITSSGTITLSFNDSKMDFVSSSQSPIVNTLNQLHWSFNLGFLQENYIDVTFNLNSPTETPPLNANDIISMSASIQNTSPLTYPNYFTLNQLAVNSYDPNDKTCLLGYLIDTSYIGKYIPYQIRFENTGTFPAQNIVVRDDIDTTKFDISSLQVLSASHAVTTRTIGNKVEFIFENINLPFDNATNDGFVIFQIKSLPTLQINDEITNHASIYFDYNFPIVTNTAITTIYSILEIDSFENSKLIKIYPVPSKDLLNIENTTHELIISIEIYNSLGQLVQKEIGTRNYIDVSKLQTGNYFLKINTTENHYTKQLIKE